MLEYYEEHGTCNIPSKAIYECDLEGLGEDGGVYHYVGNLGYWLYKQRQARNGKDNKKITPERQALLQKLVDEGKCEHVFNFFMQIHISVCQNNDHLCFAIVNILCFQLNKCLGKLNWELKIITELRKKQGDIDWHRNYAALLEYYKEHETCNVPFKTIYECDLGGLGENGGVYHYVGNLGPWLNRQRKAKKGLDNRKITPERQALLQKLVDEGKGVNSYIGMPHYQPFVFCVSQ